MGFVLLGLAMVFGLVGLVCNIIILIHAFKSDVTKGFLCLCVPCYILYYMFTEFEHDKKNLIIGGALGGNLLSGGLNGAGQAMMQM